MRLLPAAILVLALALAPAVAHAGHGFVPPMRIDVGPASSQVEPTPGLQIVAGLHWASLSPSANIDVGVGIVSTQRRGDEDPATMDAGRTAESGREPLSYVGGYLEVATRTSGNGWWRTWIGSRLESGRAWRDDHSAAFVGVATRVSTEAYLTTDGGGGGRGLAIGSLAIGLYGELSARRFDGIGNDVGVSLGVSMRIPLIAN